MMSLQIIKDLIRQYHLTGTAHEIADALNAKTVDVPYSELVTSTGVLLELGPDMAREILARFQAVAEQDPLMWSQLQKLNSTGIDFSHPLTIQMIDQLQANDKAGRRTREQFLANEAFINSAYPHDPRAE